MAAPADRVKQTAHMKTIIERGASWTLEETKLLLKLWGQDQVSRKDTPHKRTKEVYEKIASQFNEHGYERTPDQVRTRVFNMIAEYRRILKDPNPEKRRKCIFFDAMHKIYEAQHWSEVRPLLCDYDVNGRPYSPFSGEKLDIDENFNSDNDTFDGQDHDNSSTEASNTGNSASNNNNSINNNNMDTSESKQNQTPHNSATSDNNTNSSINEKSTTEKNPGSNDEHQNSHKRICLVANVNNSNPAPVAGTSQGDSSSDTKQDTNSTTSNNVGGPSSSSTNAQSASSASASASQSNVSGKLQSLLASVAAGSSTQATSSVTPTPTAMTSSTSSATPNPIIKLATPGNNSASYINFNSTKLPIVRSQIVGHSNGNDSTNTNGTQASGTRIPTTAAITSHQLYQAPVNTFDVTSSALLIDRMFAHLSRESENMREWIALEKDRIALEKARRAQDIERESRRERVLIDTLMKFQEQWLNYLARSNPSLLDGPIPELNIPPKESE